MATGTYEFQSEFAKKHQARGRVEERAQAILDLLEARGLPVPDDVRTRILACADGDQLSVWFRKAVTAPTVDQVF